MPQTIQSNPTQELLTFIRYTLVEKSIHMMSLNVTGPMYVVSDLADALTSPFMQKQFPLASLTENQLL